MGKKFGFSKKPWLRKQAQIKEIELNKLLFEQEQAKNKTWAKRKDFKGDRYIKRWGQFKDEKEEIFTDLALNSLSVCDAAAEVNEALLRGLGIKETAIDMDAVEDLAYNIYVIKLAEVLCSSKGANLSRSLADKVLTALINQILPPSVAQKPTDSRRGDKLLQELTAIRSPNK